jgi:hypothetical protein
MQILGIILGWYQQQFSVAVKSIGVGLFVSMLVRQPEGTLPYALCLNCLIAWFSFFTLVAACRSKGVVVHVNLLQIMCPPAELACARLSLLLLIFPFQSIHIVTRYSSTH